MTFFNKKEDVLEIELTQFGKYRLSQGEFDPVYYAFFDDDIIYDASYGGVTNEVGGNQNLAEERIKDSIRNRTQHVYTGIETEVTRNNLLVRTGEIINDGKAIFAGKKDPNLKAFRPSSDNNFSSYAPLGTSDLGSIKMPAWKINLYKGEFSNTSIQLTSSATSAGMKIPQLDATIEYVGYVTDGSTPSPNSCGEPGETKSQKIKVLYGSAGSAERTSGLYPFPDGTAIHIVPEQLLLKVEEINSHYTNYNFDIEVFEITSSQDFAGNIHQEWAPLYFKPKADNYLDYKQTLTEEDLEDRFPDLDSTYVRYFIDVRADKEISEKELCPVIAQDKDKIKSLYGTEYNCPDLDLAAGSVQIGEDIIKDIYVSAVGKQDIEDCD